MRDWRELGVEREGEIGRQRERGKGMRDRREMGVEREGEIGRQRERGEGNERQEGEED